MRTSSVRHGLYGRSNELARRFLGKQSNNARLLRYNIDQLSDYKIKRLVKASFCRFCYQMFVLRNGKLIETSEQSEKSESYIAKNTGE